MCAYWIRRKGERESGFRGLGLDDKYGLGMYELVLLSRRDIIVAGLV